MEVDRSGAATGAHHTSFTPSTLLLALSSSSRDGSWASCLTQRPLSSQLLRRVPTPPRARGVQQLCFAHSAPPTFPTDVLPMRRGKCGWQRQHIRSSFDVPRPPARNARPCMSNSGAYRLFGRKRPRAAPGQMLSDWMQLQADENQWNSPRPPRFGFDSGSCSYSCSGSSSSDGNERRRRTRSVGGSECEGLEGVVSIRAPAISPFPATHQRPGR